LNVCEGGAGDEVTGVGKEEAYTHTHIIIINTHAEESRERNGTVTRDISFGALASPPPLTVGSWDRIDPIILLCVCVAYAAAAAAAVIIST